LPDAYLERIAARKRGEGGELGDVRIELVAMTQRSLEVLSRELGIAIVQLALREFTVGLFVVADDLPRRGVDRARRC
jgi:hypothetical protein